MKDNNKTSKTKNSWASWTNVVLGVWLIIAPFLLGYSAETTALWNDIIVGLFIVGFGWYAGSKGNSGASWTNAVIGAWLLSSPFVLNYGVERAGTNDMIVGLTVLVLAIVAGASYRGERRPQHPAH